MADTATSETAAPAPSEPPAWTALPRAVWPFTAGIALAALLHFLVRPAIGGFGATVLMFAGINIILAVSLTAVNGFTGQFSIGHAGFMSLGGYLGAALVYYSSFRLYGTPRFHGGLLSWTAAADFTGPLIASGDLLFLGACVAAGVFAAAVGWLVGLPSLRLRGDYLAIVTLGFGEIVRVMLQASPDQFSRSDRAKVAATQFPRLLEHLGGSLGFSDAPTYSTVFWIWTAVFTALVATVRLKQSSYGRALLSVREDPTAAQAIGVNVTRYKVRAFMFGAFFAGIAGALYALQPPGSINAGDLGFQKSFDIVIMVVLGGLGSVSGAALAAVLLTVLPELLRDPPSLWPWGLVAAAIVGALILLFAPRRRGPLITLVSICIVWEGGRWLAAGLSINLADYRMIIYALALIVMMIVRPEGLFGVREIWDYWPQTWRRRSRLIVPGVGSAALLTSRTSQPSEEGARVPTLGTPHILGSRMLLDVQHISISFGGLCAVEDFSCAVPPGALHGLIGPNGAGKTTAFNLLTGVYRPTRGTISVAGRRVDGFKPHEVAQAGVSRTFQNIRLFGQLSVLDNVRIGCQARFRHGIVSAILRTGRQLTTEREIDIRARQLLDLFGLAGKERLPAASLPYGDQRRLEIARALATQPRILLLDEPAAGMNPQEKQELMRLIRFIREQFALSILLIEHDMTLVMNICERITVLDHGEIIACGSPEEVRANPKVIEAYLGEPD